MNFRDLVTRLNELENTTHDDVETIEPNTEEEKADELDDMVDQYIALNGTDNDFAEPDTFDHLVAESIYESLVESFGYQTEEVDAMGSYTGGESIPGSMTWKEFNKFPIVTINGNTIYDGEDLLVDLGLAIVIATVGPAAGPLIMPRLYKLANIIKKTVGATKPASKEAISAIAKTYKEKLAAGWRSQLGAKALGTSAGITMGVNALLDWIKQVQGGNVSTNSAVDVMGNATGQSN